MCNPPPDEQAGTGRALRGHSAAAHRVHGWCATCPGRDAAQETVAWRVKETRRHEATQGAAFAAEARRHTVDLAATHDHPCPACGQEALTLVTVSLYPTRGEQRTAGGWAYCTACDATPHPLWETTAPGTGMPFFVDCTTTTAPCPACQEPDALLAAVFTATTRTAVHEIGRWSLCLACEHIPTLEDPHRG